MCYPFAFNPAKHRPQTGIRATYSLAGMHSPRLALLALSDDTLRVVFEGLRKVLNPRVSLNLSSACRELWALTQATRQQLKADYEEAVLCRKLGKRSYEELREATVVSLSNKDFSAADLALLLARLVEGLALPAVTCLKLAGIHMGDAGATELATAFG